MARKSKKAKVYYKGMKHRRFLGSDADSVNAITFEADEVTGNYYMSNDATLAIYLNGGSCAIRLYSVSKQELKQSLKIIDTMRESLDILADQLVASHDAHEKARAAYKAEQKAAREKSVTRKSK